MAGLHGHGTGMVALDNEDLREEEVWAVMKARDCSSSNSKTRKSLSSSSPAWRPTAAQRAIPRAGCGSPQESPGAARAAPRQVSAPVNIPDWSKILRKRPKKNLWDDERDAENDADGRTSRHIRFDDPESGGDDDDGDVLPPHEYLARRLASTQIASFSMCEGIGRTLKGRDLSNLRNAILSKTGFLE